MPRARRAGTGRASRITAPAGSRSQNRKALNAAIEEITGTRDSAEWIERFNEAGVPAGPIYAMDQVFADPQVRHLGIAQPVEHPVARPHRIWSARR